MEPMGKGSSDFGGHGGDRHGSGILLHVCGALQCELHSRLQALSDDLEDLEGVIASDEQVV